MAGDGFGFSRDIPIAAEGGPGTPAGGGRVSGLSPQEAVKILSLRVPERAAANSIAPLPLLTGPGGLAAGAQGLDALLQGLVQAFQGGGRGPQGPTFGGPGTPSNRPQPSGGEVPRMPAPPNLPPPVIRPGEEPPPDTGGSGGESGGGSVPPLPIPTPDVQSPFSRPGRNPRLAEKAGYDLEAGRPLF